MPSVAWEGVASGALARGDANDVWAGLRESGGGLGGVATGVSPTSLGALGVAVLTGEGSSDRSDGLGTCTRKGDDTDVVKRDTPVVVGVKRRVSEDGDSGHLDSQLSAPSEAQLGGVIEASEWAYADAAGGSRFPTGGGWQTWALPAFRESDCDVESTSTMVERSGDTTGVDGVTRSLPRALAKGFELMLGLGESIETSTGLGFVENGFAANGLPWRRLMLEMERIWEWWRLEAGADLKEQTWGKELFCFASTLFASLTDLIHVTAPLRVHSHSLFGASRTIRVTVTVTEEVGPGSVGSLVVAWVSWTIDRRT